MTGGVRNLFLCLILVLFSPLAGAEAAAQSQKPNAAAEKAIQDMAGKAIDFLGDKSLTFDQRKKQFRQLLRNNYDMKTIGKFALGRYWRPATEAQRREYLALFETMIVDIYSRRFADYNGQDFVVRGSRSDESGDVIVTSAIVQPNGSEVKVDWRVRNKGEGYKVIDVIVEGVSMALTQRSDFASVIQRGGGDMNVLLVHMRDPAKTKNNAPS